LLVSTELQSSVFKSRKFVSWLILLPILFLSFVFFCESSRASPPSEQTPPQELRGDWFYHWGDLPKNSGTHQWNYSHASWKKIDFPESIPGRSDESIVWIKIDLPSGNWRDPYLFVSAVDLTMQVFQNDDEIYHFGEIDTQGNSKFEGWPWHAFRLPENYDQHTLYFRIFSDYSFIGLSGEVSIGNKFGLLDDVYRRGIAGLSFILVVLLVGIISTVMGVIKKDRAVAISTGLLSFNLAIMMFSENELSQVVLFEPLLWRYIAAFSYFLIPAFLSVIVLLWLKEKPPLIARSVLAITLLFCFSVAGLDFFSEFNFVNAYPYFDGLFIVLVLALLAGCAKQFIKNGITGGLMTFGILALFVSLLLDMLSAHGLISWIGRAGQWGLLLFTIASLGIYLVRDWQQQIALAGLTQQLESKIAVRTSELQDSQKKLEQLAREDFLTGLLNRRAFTEMAIVEGTNAIRHHRPISLLLVDLDHFKDVNDKYGHAVGDLVLKAVSSTCKDTCRDGELVCRYGGEEFVILLHDTYAKSAKTLSSRLCEAIKKIRVQTDIGPIKITASFGLISLTVSEPDQKSTAQVVEHLLTEADKLMYEVKIAGRDGVKSLEVKL